MAEPTTQQRAIALIYKMLDREPSDHADPLAATLADLGADSLDVIEISMELEQAFDVEITDEEVDALSIPEANKTVGDWWLLVEAKLGAPANG
ncbi:phosphopantetheine-binding protein [Novosphingobium gossypii]|uniref:phosphopantetheine-binding protein n=1 Tax=Novosphingobium gossypii TaxID=1604774 RepID=UPI003D1D74ED